MSRRVHAPDICLKKYQHKAWFIRPVPRLSMAADSPADGIWVFEDTTASLSFEDGVAMPDAFVQTTDTNIGFSGSAFWIRVELTNDTDELAEVLSSKQTNQFA